MALWPSFFRAPSFETSILDDYTNSMRQADRYMREMERSISQMNRRLNAQLPDDMRSRQAELWHIENPIVTDNEGNRKLNLRLDVRQFKPEEIQLKTKAGNLEVHAKHEETTDTSKVFREYHRTFALPEGVDPESLKSVLNSEGLLVIEAPLPALPEAPKEHVLKIEHTK